MNYIYRLRTLRLESTNVSGFITTQLGLLQSLAVFDLSNTSLSGPIPSEFGLLSGLTYLGLHNTNLSGDVPEEVCSMIASTVSSGWNIPEIHVDCSRVSCDCNCTCA